MTEILAVRMMIIIEVIIVLITLIIKQIIQIMVTIMISTVILVLINPRINPTRNYTKITKINKKQRVECRVREAAWLLGDEEHRALRLALTVPLAMALWLGPRVCMPLYVLGICAVYVRGCVCARLCVCVCLFVYPYDDGA